MKTPSLEKLRKSLATLFCAAALLTTLFGCSKPPQIERGEYPLPKDAEISKCNPGKYGGVFVLTESQEPKTFNPLMATDTYSSNAISMMLSPLVTYDPFEDKTVPALAKSWEISEDKKTYTFHLREGAKFSDGADITADDVIFTFETIFAPQLDSNGNPVLDSKTGKPLLRYPSRYAGQYTIGGEPIKFRKVGKYSVEFKTKKVYAPFMIDIGFIEILPAHKLRDSVKNGTFQQEWSTQTAINSPSEIISSGPFMLFSYKPGERLVMQPNPHYWRADKNGSRLPYIDFLIYKFVADANTATILFATGQCDASSIEANNYAWVKDYAQTYDFKIYERGASPYIFFMWFNQNPGKNENGTPFLAPHKYKWFSNKKFRQAIMGAIDRGGIIKSVWFGRAVQLDTIISPANKKWYNPNVRKYEYSPENSRKILLEIGFSYRADGRLVDPEGNTVDFEFIVADGSQNSTVTATTFVENMKAIGIEVRLKFMDFGTIISKIDNTFDYEAAMMGFTGGGDPSGGKAIYRSDGFLHVWNPRQTSPATEWERQVDEIIDRQEVEMDPDARKKLIWQMQEIFSEELPLIYLTTPMSYSGISKKWKNVKVPPIGSIIWNLDELYLDEEDN